jgi:ribonuclease VapC
MVIDTSAVVAILQNEPERRTFNEAIERAEARRLSVVSTDQQKSNFFF